MNTLEDVVIKTFVNPHLFWVVKKGHHEDVITKLEKLGKQHTDEFNIGEIVGIVNNNICCRAQIEEITHGTVSTKTKFRCWLLDYASMIECEAVFSLPEDIKMIPPKAMQASLKNLVYVEMKLDIESTNIVRVPSIVTTAGACKLAVNVLSNCEKINFVPSYNLDGVLYGDILYTHNGEIQSLSQNLLDSREMVLNKAMFQRLQKKLVSYKNTHLEVITKISQNVSFGGNSQSIINRVNNVAQQNLLKTYKEDRESTGLEPFYSGRTSNHTSCRNTSIDSVPSVNVKTHLTAVQTDIAKTTQSKTNQVDRKKRMAALLSAIKEQNKRNDKEKLLYKDVSSDETDFGKENYEAHMNIDNNKTDKTNNFEKRKFPNNALILPGGCCKSPKSVQIADDIRHHKSCTDDERKSESPSDIFRNNNVHQTEQYKLKSQCRCKDCVFWTEDDDWDNELNFETVEKEKCIVIKPPLLLKTGKCQEEFNGEILSINYSALSRIQKEAIPKLLVHGESIPIPVKQISDINIHKVIHSNLRNLNYVRPKRIQTYVFPALTRNQHVVMIGDAGAGKTWAYLPVLCSFIQEKNERYRQLQGGGPLAIILCNNSKKCEEIYDLIKLISVGVKYKTCLVTYPIGHVNTKHVDILVTMPTVLSDLLSSRATNLKRLCHLVLEDGEVVLKNHQDLMEKIFISAQQVLTYRWCPKTIQLVVCARRWSMHIEKLCIQLATLPFIAIGNYVEAALYGRINFVLKFLNGALKHQELTNQLEDCYKFTKTVILCGEENIEDIEVFFLLKGIENTAIKENMKKEDMLYLAEIWDRCCPGDYRVLICSDNIFNSVLSITSASMLIHYSLPNSWTKFVKRFECLLENCKSPLDVKQNQLKISSVIFIDEDCKRNMHKFAHFFTLPEFRQYMKLPEKLELYFENTKEQQEDIKVENGVDLCTSLKKTGFCTRSECPNRHKLNKTLDGSSQLPESGKIKFRIVEMIDVTTYNIKILEVVDFNNVVHTFNDKTDEINMKLTKSANESVSNPKVNHDYAYSDGENFFRCKLININTEDCISIKLIDIGISMEVSVKQLYKIPEKYKDIPQQCFEVRLSNLVPPYQDENFSSKSFKITQTLLDENDFKNMIMVGEILLKTGNTLWLKNIDEEREMFDKTLPNVGLQLSVELLTKKLVEKNASHLDNLYKLCKEADIHFEINKKECKTIANIPDQAKPEWAFLDMDTVNEVTFSSGVSPDEFYVKLKKFQDQLLSLQREIQYEIKKPFYPTAQSILLGRCYLAKDPEGEEYARVIVRETDEQKALCFFVDYGDEKIINITELKHLSNKLITKLPFQTIQCRLIGVKPIDEEWLEDATDILYTYSMEPNSHVFRSLYVKAFNNETNVVVQKQRRYSVLLKDGYGEKHILINKILVECGVAVDNNEIINDFEIPEIKTCAHDEESDIEVIDVRKEVHEMVNNEVIQTDEQFEEIFLEGMDDPMVLDIIDPIQFFKECMGLDKSSVPEQKEFKREFPAIKAAPPVEYHTPEVIWSQTDSVVKLTIKIPDVKEFTAKVPRGGRILIFSTEIKEKRYSLNLLLYERVQTLFQHTCIGPHVRIVLTKVKNDLKWPRLLISQERARYIHYDVETLNVEEDKKTKLLELPIEDTDCSDEEIDLMYHVSSDLELDYDHEVHDEMFSN